MRERQYSKEEWQKILSRINKILDFSDLKCTHSTEQNKSISLDLEIELIFYISNIKIK